MIGHRYEVEREIGRGGMGAVWLAHDRSLDRHVAMKRLGLDPATDSPDAHRAEREAVLGAELHHPHVVTVLDLVTEGEDHWLVMEYVGDSLAARIKNDGALDPDEVAPLLTQAADALAAAHTAGIIHRDVKPSNLLIASDGVVKLSDFGVARHTDDPTLTATGLVTGSPAYLAPEVARGGPATPQSDMWALGATLVHAVTGRPPYRVDQANPLATLYRIAHDPPPRPREAGWLDPLVVGTMTHDPAARWSGEQVRDFLRSGRTPQPASTGHLTRTAPAAPKPAVPPTAIAPTPVMPEQARRRRQAPVIASLVVVAMLAVAAAVAVGYTLNGTDGGEGSGGSTTQAASTSQAEETSEPTAESITRFVHEYLRLVADHPQQAYAMLTTDFQNASGGLEGYLGWWEQVEETEVLEVRPDPESMRVDYDYRYQMQDGTTRTETIQLQLVYDGEQYLIAGEA